MGSIQFPGRSVVRLVTTGDSVGFRGEYGPKPVTLLLFLYGPPKGLELGNLVIEIFLRDVRQLVRRGFVSFGHRILSLRFLFGAEIFDGL